MECPNCGKDIEGHEFSRHYALCVAPSPPAQSRTERSKEEDDPTKKCADLPEGTVKTTFDATLTSAALNGIEQYRKDRDLAFHWFDSQAFPQPGLDGESKVHYFIEMSSRADDSSLWDEVWGGYHHALADALVLNMVEHMPDILWHLGRAQTGREHYDLAYLYLRAACSLAEQAKDEAVGFRALLEIAVVGKLNGKPELVQRIYQQAEPLLFPVSGEASFAKQVAMTFFHEGKKNQEWRRDDQPIRYCVIHARGLYEVSLDINRRLNDKRGISINLVNLGDVWRELGQRDRAMACWREAIPLLKQLQDHHSVQTVGQWMSEL